MNTAEQKSAQDPDSGPVDSETHADSNQNVLSSQKRKLEETPEITLLTSKRYCKTKESEAVLNSTMSDMTAGTQLLEQTDQILKEIVDKDVNSSVVHGERCSTPTSSCLLNPETRKEKESLEQEDTVTPELRIDVIEIDDSQRVSEAAQKCADSSQMTTYKSKFYIVLHKSDGSITTRVAKLDTASELNALSEDVFIALGVEMKPYYGESLVPLGPHTICPLGQVRLEWNVSNKLKTYKTDFLVLKADDSKLFDVLLGDETIKGVGFYQTNPKVWCVVERQPSNLGN